MDRGAPPNTASPDILPHGIPQGSAFSKPVRNQGPYLLDTRLWTWEEARHVLGLKVRERQNGDKPEKMA